MIVEDGTGLTNSDSYASLADALTYHADRGNTAWAAASTPAQTSALLVATDYIEAAYQAKGFPLNYYTQSLQWPRIRHRGYDPRVGSFRDYDPLETDLFVGDPLLADQGLDVRVKRATMILALDALAGPLSTKVDRPIKSQDKELSGVGKISITYDQTDVALDPYPHVTTMLAPIAARRSASVSIGRVTR